MADVVFPGMRYESASDPQERRDGQFASVSISPRGCAVPRRASEALHAPARSISSTQARASPATTMRPRSASIIASHTLIGESQSSLAGATSSRVTRRDNGQILWSTKAAAIVTVIAGWGLLLFTSTRKASSSALQKMCS